MNRMLVQVTELGVKLHLDGAFFQRGVLNCGRSPTEQARGHAAHRMTL